MFCWTLHLNGGPDRFRPAVVAVEKEVYCFGGAWDGFGGAHDSFGGARNGNSVYSMHTIHFTYISQIDVDVFNTVSLRWRKLSPVAAGGDKRHLDVPTKRAGHTAVLIGDTIYIWGGKIYDPRGQIDCSTCCDNVFYAFDVDTHGWFKPKVSGTVPEKRCGHSACVLGEVMFILGGYPLMDLYKLDTTTMVWSLISSRAYGISKYAATIIGTKIFVLTCIEFNHSYSRHEAPPGSKQFFNSISVFDTETNLWLKRPGTLCELREHRSGHSPFTYNGELYIFKTEMHDMASYLWKFNPETYSWKRVELKGKGQSLMSMKCSCMVGDCFVLFNNDGLFVLDLSPSLKTLCELAVIQHRLDHSELPHNIRRELVAMRTNAQS